eukprot:scaffold1714_cov111-Isochrysis_galbana.AAC.5
MLLVPLQRNLLHNPLLALRRRIAPLVLAGECPWVALRRPPEVALKQRVLQLELIVDPVRGRMV